LTEIGRRPTGPDTDPWTKADPLKSTRPLSSLTAKAVLRRAALLAAAAILVTTATPAAAQNAPAPAAAGDCAEAKQLYRAGNFVAARTAFQECLEQGSESLDILLPLAVMGVRENRPEEAAEYAARAVELAPDDPEARYWYGRALLRGGRIEEARQQWQEGLQRDLGHKGILEALARLAITENEPAKAYQLLTQLERQGMNEPWVHRLLADIAASKRLWAESLAHLEKAFLLEPATGDDLRGASELSILAGQKDRAVDYCRRAVAIEPGAASYGSLGEAFFATDEIDSALVYLRRAVEMGGASSRFVFNLANALEVSGLFEEAEVQFQTYLQVEPQDPVGHFNYGIHLDKMGRTDKALEHVARAVELDPYMLSARVVQVQMLEQQGAWDEALAALGELRRRDRSNDAELAYWEERLIAARDEVHGADREGKVHLLHMVVGNADVLARVTAALADGEDFAAVTVRFSGGPAAAKGGDIGWIDPQEMVEPLRGAILKLGVNETSPPIESKGLFHLFRRVP
jgi:tetratricopeptide (TPR) repeat protein